MTPTEQKAFDQMRDALDLAMDNLRPHDDHCFLHDEGEYNACFCGKDSFIDHLQSVVESAALTAANAVSESTSKQSLHVATGWAAPKDHYAVPVLFNPYTGEPRDVRDVRSDPQGILIVPPGKVEMLAANAVQPQPKSVALQWVAEMIMSDCGCSTNNDRLLERVIGRIEQYERANAPAHPQATEPQVQGEAMPAVHLTQPDLETVIDNFIEDYEMRGEDENGRDAFYQPTEGDKALLKDAIFGLLADTDWDNAWGAHIAALAAAHTQATEPAGWQPIETAPKLTKVFVFYRNSFGNGRIIKARFVPRFSEECVDFEENEHVREYDEKGDCFTLIEGWYEQIDNWGDFSEVYISGVKPTHWMPLPPAPKEQDK